MIYDTFAAVVFYLFLSSLTLVISNGKLSQEQAVQFALGNINPITGDRMGNIEVDKV